MKRNLLFLFISLLTSVTMLSQKLRDETIAVNRPVKATIETSKLPIDILFYTIVDSREYPMHAHVSSSMANLGEKQFTNNQGFSKYIGYIYFHQKPASLYTKKEERGYTLTMVSNITATLYLIDREKGLISTDEIALPAADKDAFDNVREGLTVSGLTYRQRVNTTKVKTEVAEEYIATHYADPKNSMYAKYSVVEDINSLQRGRLTVEAGSVVLKKFTDSYTTLRFYFTYVKPSKDFEGTKCNEAYELMKQSVRNNDFSLAEQAITLWKEELEQPLDWTQKRTKAYQVALYENIVNAYRVFQRFEKIEESANQLLTIIPNNGIATRGLKEWQESKEPIVPTVITYTPIAPDFFPSYGREIIRQKGKINEVLIYSGGSEINAYQLLNINNYLTHIKFIKEGNNRTNQNFRPVFQNMLILIKQARRKKYFDKTELPFMEAYSALGEKTEEQEQAAIKSQGTLLIDRVDTALSHTKYEVYSSFENNITDATNSIIAKSKYPDNSEVIKALTKTYSYAEYKNMEINNKTLQTSFDKAEKLLRENLLKRIETNPTQSNYDMLNTLDVLKSNTPISNKDLGNIFNVIVNQINELLG